MKDNGFEAFLKVRFIYSRAERGPLKNPNFTVSTIEFQQMGIIYPNETIQLHVNREQHSHVRKQSRPHFILYCVPFSKLLKQWCPIK